MRKPAKPRVAQHDRPEVGARVAWTYLDCVAALIVGALAALIANPIVESAGCRFDDQDVALTCRFALVLIVFALVFLLAFGAFTRLLRLDVWVWLALVAGSLGVMMVGRIDEWWWWVLLLLVPAAAAVVSAPWFRTARAALIHHIAIAAAAAFAVVGAVIWYVFVPSA